MTDHHDRFHDWLIAGAHGVPTRDVAVHASGCESCLAEIGALDALHDVDVGAAPDLPISLPPVTESPAGPYRALRAVTGVMAVGLLVVAAMFGAGALDDRSEAPAGVAAQSGEPDGEGILGGGGGPSISPETDPTSDEAPSARPTESPTADPDESDGLSTPQPPFIAPPPPAITPQPTVVSGSPIAPPSATATAIPTDAPTPVPEPSPTPDITPTPTPDPSPTPDITPTPTPVPTPSPTPGEGWPVP